LKKEVDEARSETFSLQEKLKKREGEIESFKKDVRLKMEMLQNLEAQVETIPTLKNKIRDLEKALAQEQSRPSTSTLKSHNSQTVKEPRESESNYSKTVNISNVKIKRFV
jgi:septal ring factor EnvC (AmiA/AmiB activator)